MKYLRLIGVFLLGIAAAASLFIAATRQYVEPHLQDTLVNGAIVRNLGGAGYYNEGFVLLALAALFGAFVLTAVNEW